MDKRKALLASAVIVMAAFMMQNDELTSPAAGLEQKVTFDLDADDGGFLHGGRNDPWEWGVPGDGTTENPGPGGAKGGAWGAPLDGRYDNGTQAYLDLPQVDTSLLSSLNISFFVWYDLPLMGQMTDEDALLLMVRTPSQDWKVVLRLVGSSNGDWSEQEVILDTYLGSELEIRFLLEDHPDGVQGPGPIIDDIVLVGSTDEAVLVHFSRPLSYHNYMSAFDPAHFSFHLAGGPLESVGEAFVRVVITSEGERTILDRTITVSGPMLGTNTISWTPDSVGQFWVDVVLYGPGTDGSEQYFTAFAVDAVQYDDMERGTSPYRVRTLVGNVSWFSPGSVPGCLSLSRGRTLKAGGGVSESQGFRGTAHTVLESDWFDLRDLGTAAMSLTHSLDSSGSASSCGAVFELFDTDSVWRTPPLLMADPTYLPLGQGTGPLAGLIGFVGPYGWKETVFDITSFTGRMTKLRVSFVSGAEGRGGGLFMDDLLVWGEPVKNDSTPPPKVNALRFTIPSNGRVVLSWDASMADDLYVYRIYVGEGPFKGLEGLSPMLEVPSYEDSALLTGLDPEKVHWAAVTAVDLSGNEDREVDHIRFTPVVIEANNPPVAVIDAEFGTQRRLGEDFVFDGSRSYDPDKDPLTYVWTLPDGSTDRGVRTRWRSSSEGKDLVVRLTVTDGKGASSNETLMIDVLPEEGNIIRTGDLMQFLVCLLPLFMAILLLIVLLFILRRRRNERLKEMLREVGIEVIRHKGDQKMPKGPSGPQIGQPSPPKVVELVPVGPAARPPPSVRSKRAQTAGRAAPEKVHPVHRKAGPIQARAEPLKLEPPPPKPSSDKDTDLVRVTLECPFCGAVFKERVSKEAVKSGALENVVCPQCGRKGDIIG